MKGDNLNPIPIDRVDKSISNIRLTYKCYIFLEMSGQGLQYLTILLLGIRGAKGAPLPRLCFAQLPLSFNYYLCYEKCYVHTYIHTYEWTYTQNYLNRLKIMIDSFAGISQKIQCGWRQEELARHNFVQTWEFWNRGGC